jgi:TRAP-type C4-dicarboxylate transport system permease small subunit
MINLTNIVSYLFVFIALCIFVFLVIALANIFSKSYQPRLIIPLIIVVVLLYAYNAVAGFGAIRKTFQNLANSVEQTTSPTTPTPKKNTETKATF